MHESCLLFTALNLILFTYWGYCRLLIFSSIYSCISTVAFLKVLVNIYFTVLLVITHHSERLSNKEVRTIFFFFFLNNNPYWDLMQCYGSKHQSAKEKLKFSYTLFSLHFQVSVNSSMTPGIAMRGNDLGQELVTSTPAPDRPGETGYQLEEGMYFGYGRHKDGSDLGESGPQLSWLFFMTLKLNSNIILLEYSSIHCLYNSHNV